MPQESYTFEELSAPDEGFTWEEVTGVEAQPAREPVNLAEAGDVRFAQTQPFLSAWEQLPEPEKKAAFQEAVESQFQSPIQGFNEPITPEAMELAYRHFTGSSGAIPPVVRTGLRGVAGAAESVRGLGQFTTSRAGQAAAAGGAVPGLREALAAYFAGTMAKSGGELAGETSITKDPYTGVQAGAALGMSGLIGGHVAGRSIPAAEELLRIDRWSPDAALIDRLARRGMTPPPFGRPPTQKGAPSAVQVLTPVQEQGTLIGNAPREPNFIQAGKQTEQGVYPKAEGDYASSTKGGVAETADAWLKGVERNDSKAVADSQVELSRKPTSEQELRAASLLDRAYRERETLRAQGTHGEEVRQTTSETGARPSQERERTGQSIRESESAATRRTLQTARSFYERSKEEIANISGKTIARAVVEEIRAMSDVSDKTQPARSARNLQSMLSKTTPGSIAESIIIQAIRKFNATISFGFPKEVHVRQAPEVSPEVGGQVRGVEPPTGAQAPIGGAPSEAAGKPATAQVLLKSAPEGALVELTDLGNGQRWFEIKSGTFTPATGREYKAGQRISETQLREAGYEPPKAAEPTVAPDIEALARKAADPKAGRFTDAENQALGALTPEQRQQFLARRKELQLPAQPITPTVPGATQTPAEPSAPQAEPRPVETVGEPLPIESAAVPQDAKSALMREWMDKATKDEERSRWENDTRGGIAAGATGFDAFLKAESQFEYLRNIRKGMSASDAESATKSWAREAVATHNKKRPKDMNWQRWEGTGDSTIEWIASEFKRLEAKPKEVKPDAEVPKEGQEVAQPAEVTKAAPETAAKQPWEMTLREIKQSIEIDRPYDRISLKGREDVSTVGQDSLHRGADNDTVARDYHRGWIRGALREGKPVPPEVLADYPDLKPKAPTEAGIPSDVLFDSKALESRTGYEKQQAWLKWFSDNVASETPELLIPDSGKAQNRLGQPVSTAGIPTSVFRTKSGELFTVEEHPNGDFYAKRFTETARPVEPVKPEAKAPEFTGMGGAVPSEFSGTRVTTAHRNRIVDQEREAMGLEPMMAPLRREWPEVAPKAEAAIDRDPALPDRLLQEMLNEPRAFKNDTEVFITLRQRIELKTEYEKAARDATQAYTDMQSAKARGDTAAYEARQAAFIDDTARANAWSGQLALWDKAFKKGGASTETARSLNAMKAMMDEEYSLVALEMQKRMDVGGRELTGAERAELVKLADEYVKTITALAKHVERLESTELGQRMDASLRQILVEAAKAKKSRRGSTPVDIQDSLRKATDTLRERFDKFGIKGTGNLVQRIARLFVQQGIKEREPLIDAVHGVLKQIDPEFTRRQTMDAISGYGDFRPLSEDQISVELRDLKGQMQQVAKLEDMQKGVPPEKTGVERRVPSREESRLIKEVNEAKRKFQVPITDPATQLKSSLDTLKTRIQNRIFDLEDRLKNKDYTLVKRREPIIRDAEANRLQKQLDDIKVKWHDARFKDQMANWTLRQKVHDKILNATGLHRALMTAFEMSAVLRQGKFYVLGHPIKGVKTTYQVSKILGKELAALARANPLLHPVKAFKAAGEAGEVARHAIDQQIRNRPSYRFYERDKLALTEHGRKLSEMEEAYRSRWAQHVPGIGASERVYTTFLNLLRADMYDAMTARFENKGEISPEHGRSVARFVNAWTGRGDLPLMERTAGDLANIFFAPRFVASRFQVLSGHPFWKATPEVKRLVATEYGRTLAGAAIYYTLIASWLGLLGDDVEIGVDPRSTEFGKIRVGNTRIDPMAGLSQVTVYPSRIAAGETVTQKGQVRALRGTMTLSGKKPQYGGPTVGSVSWDFARTKLHPSAQLIATALTGEDPMHRKLGKDIGLSDLAWQQTPITYQGLLKLMEDQGIPRGTALMVLAFFGEGVNTYEPR